MPNFFTAELVKAQLKLIGAFQASELRFRIPEVHKLLLRNTDIMVPSYLTEKTRDDRVIETNFFIRQSRALGVGRVHNHTGVQGDSSTLTPAWTTHTDKFVSTVKEADKSVYSFEEMHISKINNVITNFVEGLETLSATFVFSNRTAVNVSTADGLFDAVDNTFEINEAANSDRVIDITKTTMDINKWSGSYDVVCDSISFSKFKLIASQGNANSVNTSFQFNDVRFIHDPTLTTAAAGLVSAYSSGYWLAIPTGTASSLPWIPKQNREGKDTKENLYGQMFNPIDGETYAVHSYEERVDGTSLGGFTQDVKVETEFSIDLALVTAPLTTATETTIFAFAFV